MGELPNIDFLTACGANGPLVLQREFGESKTPLALHRPYALIGRDAYADIVLESPGEFAPKLCVPPEAYLQIIHGRVLCVNLGRTVGRDASKGPRSVWLRLGRALRLGALKIRLISGVPPTPVSIHRSRIPVISLKEPTGMTWALSRPLTLIGSAAECQVRICNPEVARFHTALVSEPAGVWVVQLCCDRLNKKNNGTTPIIRRGERALLSIANSKIEIEVNTIGQSDSILPVRERAVAPCANPATPVGMIMPEQFVAMQQQMFSQFQLTINQMLETFSSIHRDQMELIRREMDRIDKLDREIARLRMEQSIVGSEKSDSQNQTVKLEPLPPGPPPKDNSPLPLVLPLNSGAVANVPQSNAAVSSPNVHAWLDHRVSQLQRERQSVWAKISEFFTRLPGDTSSPPKHGR